MTDDRPLLPLFLCLSSCLTGFEERHLLGTGMASQYYDLVMEHLGADRFVELLNADAELPAAPPTAPEAREVQHQCLIRLWYTGLWDGAMVSPAAYRAGLLWRAIGVSPPGARPPGFGSWTLPPDQT